MIPCVQPHWTLLCPCHESALRLRPLRPPPPRCSTHCTPEVSLTHLQNKTTAVQTGASCTYVILSLWIFNEKSLVWHTNSFRKQSRHQGFIITIIIIIIISLSSLWFHPSLLQQNIWVLFRVKHMKCFSLTKLPHRRLNLKRSEELICWFDWFIEQDRAHWLT